MLCEAMKWAHLPGGGGMFDQKAGLLERFYYIFAERSKYEEQEREREKRKQSRGQGPRNPRRR